MLVPWKRSYDQPRHHIKKQRHYFASKGPYGHTMVFLVVMYGCESWTIKKAENWRIDAFELWCWRKLLKIPWIARSNWSILKKTHPEYSLEGLMLKLKLLYISYLVWRAVSLEKTLMLAKIEGRRRKEQQRIRWLDAIIESKEMSLRNLQEITKDRETWRAAVHGVVKGRTWLSDWTTRMLSWEVCPSKISKG